MEVIGDRLWLPSQCTQSTAIALIAREAFAQLAQWLIDTPCTAHNGANSSGAAMDAAGAINVGIATHGMIGARHARQQIGRSLMCAKGLTMLRLMLVLEDPRPEGGMVESRTRQALIGRDGGGLSGDGGMTAKKERT